MKCKYCGRIDDFVNAHIIPAGFFRDAVGLDEPFHIWTNTPNVHPKRSPSGIYDRGLLCKQCEPKFGEWDNYAIQLHRQIPNQCTAVYDGMKILCYQLNTFDYVKLKLFFVSLLWRAAMSRHDFYKRIDIGPRAKVAKRLLQSNSAGDPDEFTIALSTFDNPIAGTFLDPHLEEFEGIRYARFYLDRLTAYIKVEEKPTPDVLVDVSMRDARPLTVIVRDFATSPEFSIALDITKNVKALRAKGRPGK